MPSEKNNEALPILRIRRFGLSKTSKFAFSIGHFLNDLCASMWFTYLLLFLHLVLKLPDITSGLLLLVGQIADGVSTIFVGLESDHGCITSFFRKYGTKKSWHLVGTICVVVSFPFIFMKVLGVSAGTTSIMPTFFYYSLFIIIFQFGWASTQISHLALIPTLTECTDERTELNAYRYAWTVIANITVFLITWVILSMGTDNSTSMLNPSDVTKFQEIVLIVVGLGSLFSIFFHAKVKENHSACQQICEQTITNSTIVPHKTWKCWFRQLSFYQIGFLYMSTRLFTNVSQTFITLYCQETLHLPRQSVAYIPLLIFGSGFLSSLAVKFLSQKLGKKITYFIGCLTGLAACFGFGFGEGFYFKTYFLYATSALLGIGSSTMLVMALSLVNDLIGQDTKSSAFVFGAMSFLDKFSNGGAIMAIQTLHPCLHPCIESGPYYRIVMGYICGGTVVLSIIAIATLIPVKFQVESLTRNNSRRNLENAPSTSHTHIQATT